MSHPNILLVEDNPFHLRILEESLQGVGATLMTATSGQEALSQLNDSDSVALIIADLHMAGMSGFELIETMRQMPKRAHTPVLLVSGIYTSTAHVLNGYSLGAVDYMLKPLHPTILRHKVEHLLTQYYEYMDAVAECRRLTDELQKLGIERQALAQALKGKASPASAIFGQQHNLATISHEIRTPLNAILNFCHLVDDDPALSASERHDYMERIKKNGRHLSRIVDDIINLAKADANMLSIQKEEFELMTAVEAVVESFAPMAKAKGLKVIKRMAGEVPLTIFSDPTRFKQILINLLDNAVKFTDTGYIVLDIRLTPRKGPRHPSQLLGYKQTVLELRVIDSGCGVSGQEADFIFEPFRQGGWSTAKQRLGSGLGLTLSHHLAKLLGGNLCLEQSIPGKGSTFCFSLQLEPEAGNGLTSQAAPAQLVFERPESPKRKASLGRKFLASLRTYLADFLSS